MWDGFIIRGHGVSKVISLCSRSFVNMWPHVCVCVCEVYWFQSKIGHFDNREASTSVLEPRRMEHACVFVFHSVCMFVHWRVEVIQNDPVSRTPPQWKRLWCIMLLEGLLLSLLCLHLNRHFPIRPLYKFMFCFMRFINVFTVQTYFQANEADGCTRSLLSFYPFPLGSWHLALFLSEVVIYKHQFVSTDQGLAVFCQSDWPAGTN